MYEIHESKNTWTKSIILNRNFLAPFGRTSGEFGGVRARPNEPDVLLKRRKRYDYVFTVPTFGQVIMISYVSQVSDSKSQDIRTVDMASDWLIDRSHKHNIRPCTENCR